MLIIGLLVVEMVVFGIAYLFGNYGIKQLEVAKKENQVLQVDVDDLKKGVEKLEGQLRDWESDNFHKEKVARERLHMSRPNEHTYHLA
jgi:cell division protein FtsB